MCGIVGIYYFDSRRVVATEHLRAMADAIVHRGPDDAGYHVEANVGIGMRRLSIIDVAGGHQPIYTPDGRYVIVFNGEVYNFKEERAALEKSGHAFTTHTDTEVVLALYAEHGIDFVDRLNGMFGLAIWDRVERELLVVRDRIGIKPVYYYRDDEKFVFASEIKAILAHPGIRAELDLEGLGAYLRYGFTPPPYTLFKAIRKLPPAHWVRLRHGEVVEHEYWRLSYRNKLAQDEAELTETLYTLLGDSVRHQMIADVPLGAFLSGGFDSSGIVHLMRDIASGPVNTYSIGFGKGFEAYNELEAAGRFAQDYGTVHHEIVVTPDVADLMPRLVGSLDEPVADSSFLVTYLVAKLARESVAVILSGVGGDELFGGYRRYLNVTLARYMRFVPRPIRTGLLEPLLKRLPVDRNSRLLNLSRLARAYLSAADLPVTEQYGRYTLLFDEGFARELAPRAAAVPDYYARIFAECDSDELLDRMMYFDLKMSLPEQLLMLTDKMTMAVSLEARVPYLDHRIVELAARLPASLKVKGMNLRYLQKQTFRGRLPSYVYEQRKKGFGAPVGVWLRNELRELVENLLGEPYLTAQGIFNPRAVATVVRAHYAQRADYTDQLLALMVFQLWYRSSSLT
jgi:asparagine synthase (glutamine-hydrolysing)